VVAITFAVFVPAVQNDFVNWDDPEVVLWNQAAHGLRPSNLAYAFTTTWFRHYHPLTWLSYGLDYTLWGLDPFGYHLTNVLLHALLAGAVFLLGRRLLQAARRESGLTIDLAAAVTAVAFALHPLRVEVVAWVTARRDVLSGLFFFATLLVYVRAVAALEAGRRPAYRRRLVLALGMYVAALLSKAIVMTLPAVLVILDWYPLRRRLGDRSVWIEKLPFAVLGGAGAVTAVWAVTAEEFTTAGPGQRLAMAAYSIAFYIRKTVVPTGLSVMYELPQPLDPLEPRFVASAALTIAVTGAAIILRRRAPWLAAAWAYYVVTLLPVSGLTHAGHQLVYLRYSYLPGAAWALLIGAVVAAAVAAWRAARLRTAVFAAVCVAIVFGVAGWAQLARWQVRTWRDPETLWKAALAVDPSCALCHHKLGTSLMLMRRPEEGEIELRRALALRPTYALAAWNLASALRERGIARYKAQDYAAAVQLFGEAVALVPGNPELLDRLARARAALAGRAAAGRPPG
jgi:hypothetical protein